MLLSVLAAVQATQSTDFTERITTSGDMTKTPTKAMYTLQSAKLGEPVPSFGDSNDMTTAAQ
jgi:hypothetical protein